MKYFLSLSAFLALVASAVGFAGEPSPFYPAQVQLCGANLDQSGEGVAYEMLVNFTENYEGTQSTCSVAYYYGFEYGSATGHRGMFSIVPQSTKGLKCSVLSKGFIREISVTKGKGPALVSGCKVELKS
ncbi:hypothetical protein WDW37_21720 [Bdellovibrionota bacterium FG-1]